MSLSFALCPWAYRRLPIVFGVVLTLSLACAPRYEWRPACEVDPPEPLPDGASALAWRQVPDSMAAVPLVLAGHVVDLDGLRPVGWASVVVRGAPGPALAPVQANADGAFEARLPAPGRYVLEVRRIGYRRVADTLELRPGQGLVATVVLARDEAMFDDSCMMQMEVRKPWWRW